MFSFEEVNGRLVIPIWGRPELVGLVEELVEVYALRLAWGWNDERLIVVGPPLSLECFALALASACGDVKRIPSVCEVLS